MMVIIIAAAVTVSLLQLFLCCTGFSLVFSLLRDNIVNFIHGLSSRAGLDIDDKAIEEFIVGQTTKSLGYVLKIINHISKELIFFVFAFVLNMHFFRTNAISHAFISEQSSLLGLYVSICIIRFKRFYSYFRKVMVGQFFISLINTPGFAYLHCFHWFTPQSHPALYCIFMRLIPVMAI